MRKYFLIGGIIVFLIAIYVSDILPHQNAVYPGVVMVNDEFYEYCGSAEKIYKNGYHDLILGSYMGYIVSKVPPNKYPGMNLESNILNTGTKIYKLLNEKDRIVGIKDGIYYVFRKQILK